jgi:FAD binding domain/Berberine and berberine like
MGIMVCSSSTIIGLVRGKELIGESEGIGGTDGAIVVNLQNLQQFSMDPSTFIATIGAGTLLGDLDQRLDNAGKRAIAHGTCPQVGIGGHATIGGLGPTSRQFGMALDHIVEADVVLANGTIVTATETQNSDLFFAIRGAGASFGVVTEFRARTEPEPGPAVQYKFTFGFGDTASRANLFKNYQSFISNPQLSRRFSATLTVLQNIMILSGTFFGTRTEFDNLGLEKNFPGYNSSNIIEIDDWLALVANWAEELALDVAGGIPASFYSKSLSLTPKTLIPSSSIDVLFHFMDTTPSESLAWFVIFDLEGGAINDTPMDATSYAHRDTLFWLQSYAIDAGPVLQKTKDFLDGINNIVSSSLPGATLGAYPGYVDPRLQNALVAYWGSNLERLMKIKAAVDPDDLFHNPQSVPLAST